MNIHDGGENVQSSFCDVFRSLSEANMTAVDKSNSQPFNNITPSLCFPAELQGQFLNRSQTWDTFYITACTSDERGLNERRWYLPVWRTVSGSKDGKRTQSADLQRTDGHTAPDFICLLLVNCDCVSVSVCVSVCVCAYLSLSTKLLLSLSLIIDSSSSSDVDSLVNFSKTCNKWQI